MDYGDKLKDILRRVITEADEEDDVGAGESDNFMDDDSGGDDMGGDEDVGAGESDNFMDDDSGGDDMGGDEDVGAGESDNFMDDDSGGDDMGGDEDVGAGESDNFMDDDSGGDDMGGDDSGSDDMGEDDIGEGESDNFMDDEGGGDDSGGEEGGDESTEDTGEEGDESSEEGGEEGEEYDLNKIEEELFSSLTPEQIAIKNHELKNQFIEVYSIIGSTLVRINDIPKSNDNINILKFITEKLLELREMIDYNITVAYSTRTYIENNIIYQQCIATLNAIADIIDNIPNVNGGESNAEAEENGEEDLGEPVEPDESEETNTLDVSDSSMSDYQEESVNYNSDYNTLF